MTCTLTLVIASTACLAQAPQRPGLEAAPDGDLLLEGIPFRGVGVNYFNAFLRTLHDPDRTDYEEGFAQLAQRRIPFARFAACGFWPVDFALYRDNPEEYFRRMDAVVRSAERHDIGLIPSLFWHYATVPDLVGEPVSAWGDPTSRTIAWMRQYTRQVAGRYKDSAAIWAWEFGNEYNLPADLPNASTHRPPVAVGLGTPAQRTVADELTHEIMRTALREFAIEVRRHDPYRLILSGNSIPRRSAWHQMHENSWTADSADQFAEMLAADNPDPIDSLCVHIYDDSIDRLHAAMDVARKTRRPLFVGEFGVSGPRTPQTEAAFEEMLAVLDEASVPLAALWVYDFERQNDTWNITPANDRAWQLEAIAALSRRWNE